ncbi:MAG: TetR/AcrR family transcriptional regulator [Thermodesulfobacteriota bacterium]
MKTKSASTPGRRGKSAQVTEATPKSDATREMIIAAARKTFVKHPFHKASIRMIAAEGGFHFSLINHYFTKSELFGAVASQVSQEMLNNFTSWLKGMVEMPPEAGFSLFLDRALDHFFEHPDVLRILMKNAGEAGSEETSPAFDHFSKYVFAGGGILINELRMEKNVDNIVVWFYGVLNLLINFVGAAHYHCQVLNMDPNGKEFRRWVKNCLMYIFTPTLKELFKRPPAG